VRRRKRAALVATVLAFAGGTAACRAGLNAISPESAALSAQHGAGLFTSISRRFTNVERTPRFSAARSRLGRSSLSPSTLIRDTTIWNSGEAVGTRTRPSATAARALVIAGEYSAAGNRYRFSDRVDAPEPARPGDSRHLIRLRPLGDADYEWQTVVDHAVGDLRVDGVARLMSGALAAASESATGTASGEGTTAAAGRNLLPEMAATFPRARVALGRLYALDTLRAIPLGDGSALVHASISLRPSRLRATMPAFAAYVTKYMAPARFNVSLRDDRGTSWLSLAADKSRLTLWLRARDGRLQPMAGAARATPPDSLLFSMDASTHISLFDVGFSRMQGSLRWLRAADESGWLLRIRRAPKWHLPPTVASLLDAPLARPFAGDGLSLLIALRRGPDAAKESAGISGDTRVTAATSPTLLHRSLHATVRESAILRWLGRLSGAAMGDFVGPTEAEENRFLAEGFAALAADATALSR